MQANNKVTGVSPELIRHLEKWLNEDPEMRWMECLVGNHLRWNVRLWQTVFSEAGSEKIAERESGTLGDALMLALMDTDPPVSEPQRGTLGGI